MGVLPPFTWSTTANGFPCKSKVSVCNPAHALTDTIVAISRRSNQIFSIYLYVRILSSLVVGILTYVVLVLLGIRMHWADQRHRGDLQFCAHFGPIIGTVVCCILLVAVSPAKMLWYIVISTVIQQAEGNIPFAQADGQQDGLPAFWVLVGVVVGGGLFGIPGMIWACRRWRSSMRWSRPSSNRCSRKRAGLLIPYAG